MKNVWDYIQEMLLYKESLGFSRKTYEGYLNDFGRSSERHGDSFFSEAVVMEWCTRRDTESEQGFRRRVTVLREFSKYLYAIGESSFVVPTDMFPTLHRYTPYIFSDKELQGLFQQADMEKYTSRDPGKSLVIPVIYKLIYFCGLRPNEGRELLTKDVDLDVGTVFIRKNKSHRERLIPMAEDMVCICREYSKKIRLIYPDSEYFFPSPSGLPYSAKWLTRNFIRLWNNSKEVENTSRVRVYDLRHRYATAVFTKWMDEKEDLYVLLPYLSAYMGHAHLEDTAYYIHLLPDKLRKSSTIDWTVFERLLPEVDYE